MGHLTGLAYAFHSADPLCQILYVCKSSFCTCDKICPQGWRHLPCNILLHLDGRLHALLYQKEKGNNAMHSDNSIEHKKWLLAVSGLDEFPNHVYFLRYV